MFQAGTLVSYTYPNRYIAGVFHNLENKFLVLSVPPMPGYDCRIVNFKHPYDAHFSVRYDELTEWIDNG